MFSKIVCASLAGCLAVGPASAQRARRTILRLEAGMLNPDDLFRVTLALGGSVGWQATPRTAVLVRYLRQSHDRNTAQDIGSRGRGFLTANWQYGF